MTSPCKEPLPTLISAFVSNITRNIVDTEDSKGNVWKMLLGSFDEYWDADSEIGSMREDPAKDIRHKPFPGRALNLTDLPAPDFVSRPYGPVYKKSEGISGEFSEKRMDIDSVPERTISKQSDEVYHTMEKHQYDQTIMYTPPSQAPEVEAYISNMARLLLDKAELGSLDKADAKRICSLLPDILQDFAQNLAYGSNICQLYRDIMVLIHVHRKYVYLLLNQC